MKLLLGYSWSDALDLADERGWSVDHTRRQLVSQDGTRHVFCPGFNASQAMAAIAGRIFDEVIIGARPMDLTIGAEALARVRAATT